MLGTDFHRLPHNRVPEFVGREVACLGAQLLEVLLGGEQVAKDVSVRAFERMVPSTWAVPPGMSSMPQMDWMMAKARAHWVLL